MASLPQQRPSPSASSAESSDSEFSVSNPTERASETHDGHSDPVVVSSAPHLLSSTQESASTLPANDRDLTPFSPPADSSATQSSSPSPGLLTRQSTSSEPKKCWICFGDSTEDGPDTSPWRTPCPCALTAHEACLLDWIADLEAPSGSTTQSRRKKNNIQCPQCKTVIRVARPWSPVVASVRALERLTGTMVLPGVGAVLLGGVFSACFVHGAVSVLLVLGPEDWARLIGAAPDGRPVASVRLTLGLPMVPVILVLSRTKLADGILPMLPLIFFAPHLSGRRQIQRLIAGIGEGSALTYEAANLWPPSAAAAFASIPYIRAVYNVAYAKLFAAKQKEWLKAVQREPRPGEEMEQQAQGAFQAAADNDELEIELNAEIQIFQQEEEQENGEEQQQANRPQQGAAQPGNAPARPQAAQHNNGLILSASKIADTVLGALCFPAIAAVMGETLKLSLPAKWTAASLARRPGLLQTKWGRSIIGGCLFVVMKDALLLYSHYRMAQDHAKRRVMDYRGPSTRSKGSTPRS